MFWQHDSQFQKIQFSTVKTNRHLLHRFLDMYRKPHVFGLNIEFANILRIHLTHDQGQWVLCTKDKTQY